MQLARVRGKVSTFQQKLLFYSDLYVKGWAGKEKRTQTTTF